MLSFAPSAAAVWHWDRLSVKWVKGTQHDISFFIVLGKAVCPLIILSLLIVIIYSMAVAIGVSCIRPL